MNAMQRLTEADAVARLAERDATLYTDVVQERQPILHRMGWIDLASVTAGRLPQYASIAEQIIGEGATDVVLLGMGGSSLASLVISEVVGSAGGHPRLHVLDTTSPPAVAALLDTANGGLDPAHTWFLVSSKSGTTIEPLSLYAIFRAWSDAALGTARGRSSLHRHHRSGHPARDVPPARDHAHRPAGSRQRGRAVLGALGLRTRHPHRSSARTRHD